VTPRQPSRPQVVVLQHRLLQYRLQLFERLRSACDDAGLSLRLVHGQPSPREAKRLDTGSLPWADAVRNRYLPLGSRDLLWQPLPGELRDADLVVLMQESRILSNLPWLLRAGSRPRVAFWGHGRNFQSVDPNGPRERAKAWLRNRADWWFAYTELSRAVVGGGGFPDERITVLNNAIDNDGFVADLAAVDDAVIAAKRETIAASPGAAVGLYCGSLYPDKRLDLLVAACKAVQRVRPDFRLVVVGDGPSRAFVEEAARRHPWLHCAGALRGPAKAAWFRAADCYLSPGAVGLHVLDAFCAGLPLITTDSALHGPEIAYLESGRNGFIVPAEPQTFAAAVLAVLGNPSLGQRLRAAAAEDARRYTLDHMVRRFVAGMESCLAAPPLGAPARVAA
jgi:L-malate glycosyltransferase